MIEGLKKAIKLISKAKNLRSAGYAIALLDKELKKHEKAVYMVCDGNYQYVTAVNSVSAAKQFIEDLKAASQFPAPLTIESFEKFNKYRIAKLQFLDEEVQGDT